MRRPAALQTGSVACGKPAADTHADTGARSHNALTNPYQYAAHTRAHARSLSTAERLMVELWDAQVWFHSKAAKELAERTTNVGRLANIIQGKMDQWWWAAAAARIWS